MTAPDPAGTPDSRSGTETAGQAATLDDLRDFYWNQMETLESDNPKYAYVPYGDINELERLFVAALPEAGAIDAAAPAGQAELLVAVEALETFLDSRKIIVGSPYQIDGGLWLARVANPNALARELLSLLDAQHPQPQAAPRADAVREGILRLLNDLATSASATHPSKKSQIESEIIGKLRKILGET